MIPTIDALVQDSGLPGAFHAGALLTLNLAYGLESFDHVAGTSCAASTLAYWVADQIWPSGSKIWTSDLAKKGFYYRGRKPAFNMIFLVDTIHREWNKLNLAKVMSSDTKLSVSVTNAETGEAEYMGNWDQYRQDWEQHFDSPEEMARAMLITAQDLPTKHSSGILLELKPGTRYFDGAYSDLLPIAPFGIDPDTLALPRDKYMIIILTAPEDYKKRVAVEGAMLKRLANREPDLPEGVHISLNEYAERTIAGLSRAEELAKRNPENVLLIRPEFTIGSTDNTRESLSRMATHGAELTNTQRVRSFLERFAEAGGEQNFKPYSKILTGEPIAEMYQNPDWVVWKE
ncbi:MAG: hypothetical protein ABIE94_00665 [archaeon]